MFLINLKKIIAIIFFLMVFLGPATSLAFHDDTKHGIVPECLNPIDLDGGAKSCDWGFGELLLLIKSVINFILFYFALPAATLAFIYAGWLYLTSGDNATQRKKAKNIFLNVLIGLAIAAAAWLIVSAILTGLGLNEGYSLLKDVE